MTHQPIVNCFVREGRPLHHFSFTKLRGTTFDSDGRIIISVLNPIEIDTSAFQFTFPAARRQVVVKLRIAHDAVLLPEADDSIRLFTQHLSSAFEFVS